MSATATASDIRLTVPNGWWCVDPSAPDPDLARWVAERVAERSAVQPDPRVEAVLSTDWMRLLRAARAAGAVLYAGGWAMAEGGAKPLVSASCLVSPVPESSQDPDTGGRDGKGSRDRDRDTILSEEIELPAGRVIHTVALSPIPSPQGDLAALDITYVFVDSAPQWSLRFTTPSIRHARDLAVVFHGVARSVRLGAAG